MTLSSGRPVTLAATAWARLATWVPVQISHPPGVMCTVQFIGSIGGMGEERHVIGDLDRVLAERLYDIADILGVDAGALACLDQIGADLGGIDAGIGAFVPGDGQRGEALQRGPHMVADHRDQIVEHHHLAEAGHQLRRSIVDMADLAAEHRGMGEGGELHARAASRRCRIWPGR